MSDGMESVVRLDPLPQDERAHIAAAVAAFLVAERIVVANPSPSTAAPSAWVAGPGWANAVRERGAAWLRLTNIDGVDVDSDRGAFLPMECYEPAWCGRCGVALAEDTHRAAFEEWIRRAEPAVTCPACASSALLGDWPAQSPAVVGGPAVTFHNWPDLTPGFVGQLRAVHGGRTVLVRARY